MSKILLLISQKENYRLLADFLLEKGYELVTIESPDYLEQPFDLCIIDGVALGQHRQQLQSRIAVEKPVFLPVLLVTNRQKVKMETASLWQIVDEILITPVEKRELLARVENLLRSRRLSLELKFLGAELSDSQKQVQDLKQELEALNKLFQNP